MLFLKLLETVAFRVVGEVVKYWITADVCLSMFLESILVRGASVLRRKLLILQLHDLFHLKMFKYLSQRGFKHSCFSQVLIAFIF